MKKGEKVVFVVYVDSVGNMRARLGFVGLEVFNGAIYDRFQVVSKEVFKLCSDYIDGFNKTMKEFDEFDKNIKKYDG